METAASENVFEASSSQECQLTWDNRAREVFRKVERESGRGKVFLGVSGIREKCRNELCNNLHYDKFRKIEKGLNKYTEGNG